LVGQRGARIAVHRIEDLESERVHLAVIEASLQFQPGVAQPLRRVVGEETAKETVGRQLYHGGETDAVRASRCHRTAGVANGRHAVPFAVAPCQLAAIAAERYKHAGSAANSETGPVVSVEKARSAGVQPRRVGMTQVDCEGLPLLHQVESSVV